MKGSETEYIQDPNRCTGIKRVGPSPERLPLILLPSAVELFKMYLYWLKMKSLESVELKLSRFHVSQIYQGYYSSELLQKSDLMLYIFKDHFSSGTPSEISYLA